jgi:uncharacterized damage-inducible protein DinB
LTYPESLDESAMTEILTSEEDNVSTPRWLTIVHIVNHWTQHRSDMAHYLTECGHSPGDLDLL